MTKLCKFLYKFKIFGGGYQYVSGEEPKCLFEILKCFECFFTQIYSRQRSHSLIIKMHIKDSILVVRANSNQKWKTKTRKIHTKDM